VAAAARRNVGDVPAAEALKQLAELGGLVLDLSGKNSATFMMVVDSSIVNVTSGARRVKVKRQQAASASARVVDRHRARLLRRLGGHWAGPPGRVGTAEVARCPDVRRTCE
jgi:hypothetical protein